jgi:hypothetical protein
LRQSDLTRGIARRSQAQQASETSEPQQREIAMYQIFGVQRNMLQRPVAMAKSARETLAHCHDASELFMSIIVIDPQGAGIDLAALSSLATEEGVSHS